MLTDIGLMHVGLCIKPGFCMVATVVKIESQWPEKSLCLFPVLNCRILAGEKDHNSIFMTIMIIWKPSN